MAGSGAPGFSSPARTASRICVISCEKTGSVALASIEIFMESQFLNYLY